MKTGRTLIELAEELQRQLETKRDFVSDTRSLGMIPADKAVQLRMLHSNEQTTDHAIRPLAHRQIGERVKIPATYYDRCLQEDPELLAYNVNRWFSRQPEQRMIRTLDGQVRAFLSNRYRPLDNWDLANVVLPVLKEATGGALDVHSCEITEHRMYLKVIFPRISADIGSRKVGDIVQSGIVVSNSEVGAGALKVEPLVFHLACLNGMIAATAMKRHHVGRAAEGNDESAYEIYRDETLAADDRAFWMKVQDTVKASVSEVAFAQLVDKIRAAQDEPIQTSPLKAVEAMTRRFTFSETERESVLTHLIKGGDLSRWGMVEAITAASQDLPDYDRATEFERIGGVVLELPQSEWKVLAKKAA